MDNVQRGCELFANGKPFEAHEEWETRWNELRQGIDPVGAAELHAAILLCGVRVLLDKKRIRGAIALLKRTLELRDAWFTGCVLVWDKPEALVADLGLWLEKLEGASTESDPVSACAALGTFGVKAAR